MSGRLNALRAAVLGANDGILSMAGLVIGVAGATTQVQPVFIAGMAGLTAGAVSMALGEYVSVSSQRDSEKDLIAKEKRELAENPEAELEELAGLYEQQGLSSTTAAAVAQELTARNPLKAHLRMELGVDEEELTNPWHAAGSSAVAFLLGGLLPVLAILLSPVPIRVWITYVIVLVALALTGAAGAKIGGGSVSKAALRVVVGGAVGLMITYGIGLLFGATVI
ncbi:VIT1/CCC1 transporter family protein [Arthrobacter sp. TB 23]|uniref:VIT1/CCC1 transporter family protein n=1 Tax=Arthrobacter sp. TB 23 TaxID=494419 RepID=UPI0009FC8F5B